MKRRGFTMIEAAALTAVCGLGATVLGIAHYSSNGPRDTAKLLKDATQVRQIGMSLIVFAQENRDKYPIPGQLDAANATIDAEARTKDHTAAVYSILIYSGMVPPEIFISPFEDNPQVKEAKDYQFEAPAAAASPDRALWDPSFSVDFTGDHIGNASYAHQQLSDDRLRTWATTFSAMEPQLSTRGPLVTKVDYGEDGSATPTLANPESRTLGWFRDGLIGKKGDAWTGNILFADSHVESRKKMIERTKDGGFAAIPLDRNAGPTLRMGDPQRQAADVIFHDEKQAKGDAFFGLWITAGAKPEDFKGAWD